MDDMRWAILVPFTGSRRGRDAAVKAVRELREWGFPLATRVVLVPEDAIAEEVEL